MNLRCVYIQIHGTIKKGKGIIIMKKVYESPVFVAEEYNFSDSIAQCDIHPDDYIENNNYLEIALKDNICGSDNGHKAGSGAIPESLYPVRLFNDGSDVDVCAFDWDGKVVKDTNGISYGSFQAAFAGDSADNPNHTPAFKGQIFFS